MRSHLKKVFWPNLGVGPSVQILEILQYSSGSNLAASLILNQNPFFEKDSIKFDFRLYGPILYSGPGAGMEFARKIPVQSAGIYRELNE